MCIKRLIALGFTTSLIASSLYGNDCSIGNSFGIMGEWTMMRRSLLHDSRLAVNPSNGTVFHSSALVRDFKYEPGFRLGAYYQPSITHSYEFLYLNCGEWHGEKEVIGPVGTLSFPFQDATYSHDFTAANSVSGDYKSSFWTTEVNYWKHVTPRFDDYFSFSWLAGLRYMNLTERFKLEYSQPGYSSPYRTSVYNHMAGAQVGIDLQVNPQNRLSWDVLVKAGLLVDWAEEKTYLGDLNNTITLRNSKDFDVSVPFFTEASMALAYQFNTHFNIHGGYQMLYVTGVALAPEQLSKKTSPNAGANIDMTGQALVHGWFLGLTFGF